MAITGIQGASSPHIIVQGSTSINGFATVNTSWVFAIVKVIYPGCMNFSVGDSVFFDKSQSKRFLSGPTNYFVVDEAYIYFIETPDPIVG